MPVGLGENCGDEEVAPRLVESSDEDSDDEDTLNARWIKGDFPWGKRRCLQADFSQQVTWWKQLPHIYQKSAYESMKKLVLSPFLFQNKLIPEKWLLWAGETDMIEYEASERVIPTKRITRRHYLAARMIDMALDKVEELTRKATNITSILKLMYDIKDKPSTCRDIAIRDTQDDEKIKLIVSYLTDSLKKVVVSEDIPYVTSEERCVLTTLLCCRQFAEVLSIITNEGRDVVQEVAMHYGEKQSADLAEKLETIRKNGREMYQTDKYQSAYDYYTKAISLAPFQSLFYSNRCQASIKLKDYRGGLIDAYRAVVLKPTWAKAYYKVVSCFATLTYANEAIDWGRIGIHRCREDPDWKELESLFKRTVVQFRSDVMKESLGPELMAALCAKKKSKNKKRKKKQRKDGDDAETPPMAQDDDDWEDSGDAEPANSVEANEEVKPLDPVVVAKMRRAHSVPAIKKIFKESEQKANKEKEKIRRQELKDSKREEAEITKRKLDKKTPEDGKKEQKERDEPKIQNSSENNKKNRKQVEEGKKDKCEPGNTKEREFQLEFDQHLQKGSQELLEAHFSNSVKYYTSALEMVEEKKLEIHKSDHVVLLYARGMASVGQMTASEIDTGLKFFSQILAGFKSFGHIGMVYYVTGNATYLLNNFQAASEHILKGLQLIKNFPLKGQLTWPGTTKSIPESDEIVLRQKMKILLQQCRSPPRPTAVCLYEACGGDYHRKEIYLSDLVFEGYFTVSCDWHCCLRFHLKCWSKFKHAINVAGDKDVLGLDCSTPDCQGKIVLIIMIDDQGLERFSKSLPKSAQNKETKELKSSKYDRRTSKSKKNLLRYKRIQAEKKQLRKKRKFQNHGFMEIQDDSSKNKEHKIKNDNIPADQDLSEARIYRKTNADIANQNQGVKQKTKMKLKRRAGPVSLQYFCQTLPGYRRNMSMHEVVEAIEKAKEDGKPFSLPDDLREEIEEFEEMLSGEKSSLFTDDDRMKLPFLFEYFQDFFLINGPQNINEGLFTNQFNLLPSDMQDIVTQAGGLTSFLNSSPLFVLEPPYIGVQSQHDKMLEGHNACYMNAASSRSSSMDMLVADVEGNGLSQFAQDFYEVGALAEDIDIQDLTGGQEQSSPNDGQNEMYKLDQFPENTSYSQNSETSSQYSLEDDTKSEAGSQASFDFDRLLFKRPSTPLRKGGRATSQNGSNSLAKKKFEANSVGTQTEVRDESEKAKEALERLQERLVVMEDKMTKQKNTANAHQVLLQKQIEQASESERYARTELERIKQHAEAEFSKIAALKKQWQEKLRVTKEQADESRIKEEQAKSELANLSVGVQQERDKLLKEIVSLRKTKEEQEKLLATNASRAIEAEVGLVKMREAVCIQRHMQAQADSEQHAKEYERQIARLGLTLPEHALRSLQGGLMHWTNNIITCQQAIKTLKAAYDSIIKQIRDGRLLSELPPVPELTPPLPGPNLQQMLLRMKFGGTAGVSGGGVNLNNTAPNSVNSKPSLAKPAQLQLQPSQSSVTQSMQAPTRPQLIPNQSAQVSSAVPKTTVKDFQQTQPSDQQGGVAAAKTVKKKNFQQLLLKLGRNFPQLTSEQLEHYTQQVRAENRGLTGLSYDEIENRIGLMLRKDYQNRSKDTSPQTRAHTVLSAIPRSTSTPAPWAASWTVIQPNNGRDRGDHHDDVEDEESMCPICCDPLKEGKVCTLECRHRFHFTCINKWMQKQRTCPNCRKFMADTKEFPSLSSDGIPPGLMRNHSNGGLRM